MLCRKEKSLAPVRLIIFKVEDPKYETTDTPETLVPFYRITRRKFRRRGTALGIKVSQGKAVPILKSLPRQEDVWRNGGIYPCILSPARVSDQHYAAFAIPVRERAPDFIWIVGWVGPRAGLDDLKRFCLCRESNPDFSIVQHVA